MSRETALVLQNTGMILIVMVMLTDTLFFELDRRFILACAVISAALLIKAICVLKNDTDRQSQRRPE